MEYPLGIVGKMDEHIQTPVYDANGNICGWIDPDSFPPPDTLAEDVWDIDEYAEALA